MFIGYTFKKNDQKQSELLKALLDLDLGHIPSQLESTNSNICDSLQLDRPRIELTEKQIKNIFKKQKQENATGRIDSSKETKELLSAMKPYTNRVTKKGDNPLDRFDMAPIPIKNNFVDSANKSKQRAVKMSPSQFGKEKEQAIKKLLAKGSLRPNPIHLTSKK